MTFRKRQITQTENVSVVVNGWRGEVLTRQKGIPGQGMLELLNVFTMVVLT